MATGTGFPYVLYDLLKKESSSIVMWTSTGTAFGIRDMASFRQEVLTCYFKHNKFSSFQRQLNLYGFRKVVKGREAGCYMHPSFLRDSPEKLSEVKRGVVPPCPGPYSRKIYGSGPRFMSQDDGSDSEPELVVQPRGQWEKGVGAADAATHMRLGEMHMSAAAFAAARAQIKGERVGLSTGHVAAAAAAAHHLQAAQAHMHGVPGEVRAPPPSQALGLGGMGSASPQGSARMGPPQQAVPSQSRGGAGTGSGIGGSPGVGGVAGGYRSGLGVGSAVGVTGNGSGTSGGGEVNRGRTGRTGLSKMFGSNRASTVAASGGGGGGGGVGGTQSSMPLFMGGDTRVGGLPNPNRSPQHQHQHQQQQQQQQRLQDQMQQRQMQQQQFSPTSRNITPSPSSSPLHRSRSDDHGAMGGGNMFMPPLSGGGGQHVGGMPMGGPGPGGGLGGRGLGEGTPSRPQSSTVMSLSRLLDGLEQTLDSPPEEEMYTPIDKRNSFCAQMVNIAQVLEDDPSMHDLGESKSSQFSYLAQKRRSSVSELAAYLQDMLEGGESDRIISNMPSWSLPAPPSHGHVGDESFSPPKDGSSGNLGGGNPNRVHFKRQHTDDFGPYGDFQMGDDDGRGGKGREGGAVTVPGWIGTTDRDKSEDSADGGSGRHPNPKRARGLPPMPPPLAMSGQREGLEGRDAGTITAAGARGAAAAAATAAAAAAAGRGHPRMGGKVAAGPSVAQALTCLASGLRGHSDSEDGGGGGVRGGGAGDGLDGEGRVVGRKVKLQSAFPMSGMSRHQDDGTGQDGSGGLKARATSMPSSGQIGAGGGVVKVESDVTAMVEQPQPPKRRCSKAINDVLTRFSIDTALEQFKSDEADGGDPGKAEESTAEEQSGMRQRASVYVLMHAIAAVNTGEGDSYDAEHDEEPLTSVEEGESAATAATAAATTI